MKTHIPAPFRPPALAAFALALALAPAAFAADHLDAAGLTPPGGDPQVDLTDIFAFQSPGCSDCTVLAIALNPLTEAGIDAPFSRKAKYRLRIDTDGDAIQDLTFTAKFGKANAAGVQKFSLRLRQEGGPSTLLVKRQDGRTTPIGEEPSVIPGAEGILAFGGMIDDPFFFDLPGFLGLDFCSTDPAPDTFAGTNVTAFVVEVPSSVLATNGPNVGFWAETSKQGQRVDRMGRPAINTVFIPANPLEPNEPSQKDAFNQGDPAWDRMSFRGEVLDTLEIFYGAGSADAAAIADFLLPDILTVNVDDPSGFPNGRRPADDVIDVELGLLTNGAIATDCVDGNDVPFSTEFPYLGAAHE